MFKWNDVKKNPHPNHENPVLLSVVYGNNGVAEKAVVAGSYDSDYGCWELDDTMYNEAIVVAWADCPKPFNEEEASKE